MADYVIEMFGESINNVTQVEMSLDFDPASNSHKVRELIRDLVWSEGASLHPIEGEPGYEGWSRFVINISPPGEMEEA